MRDFRLFSIIIVVPGVDLYTTGSCVQRDLVSRSMRLAKELMCHQVSVVRRADEVLGERMVPVDDLRRNLDVASVEQLSQRRTWLLTLKAGFGLLQNALFDEEALEYLAHAQLIFCDMRLPRCVTAACYGPGINKFSLFFIIDLFFRKRIESGNA